MEQVVSSVEHDFGEYVFKIQHNFIGARLSNIDNYPSVAPFFDHSDLSIVTYGMHNGLLIYVIALYLNYSCFKLSFKKFSLVKILKKRIAGKSPHVRKKIACR